MTQHSPSWQLKRLYRLWLDLDEFLEAPGRFVAPFEHQGRVVDGGSVRAWLAEEEDWIGDCLAACAHERRPASQAGGDSQLARVWSVLAMADSHQPQLRMFIARWLRACILIDQLGWPGDCDWPGGDRSPVGLVLCRVAADGRAIRPHCFVEAPALWPWTARFATDGPVLLPARGPAAEALDSWFDAMEQGLREALRTWTRVIQKNIRHDAARLGWMLPPDVFSWRAQPARGVKPRSRDAEDDSRRAWDYVNGLADWRTVTVEDVAAEIGCSRGYAHGLPAWKAVMEWRRTQRPARAPRTIPLTAKLQNAIGSGEPPPLDQLIAREEQSPGERRRHRILSKGRGPGRS